MEHLFVPYKIAKLAKQKGFDEPCMGNYDTQDKKLSISFDNLPLTEEQLKRPTMYSKSCINSRLPQFLIAAPTQQQLMLWLMTKGLYIELIIDGWGLNDDVVSKEFICYRAFLWEVGKPRPRPSDDLGAKDYTTILNVALEDALNLIKK